MLHCVLASKPLAYEFPFLGEVEKIFTTYGFVASYDGNRYFFHFGTCASKPELLKVGDVVEFVLGEDIKTHRIHAQKVRKIKTQNVAPTPSPSAAAILNTLPQAAVLVSAQTLLNMAAAVNFIPYQQAAARLALANSIMNSTSCNSATPVPVPVHTPPPISNFVEPIKAMKENVTIMKRAPLRQIEPQQQNIRCQTNEPIGWDGILFKPFPVGTPPPTECQDANQTMAMAFERAREAWYSIDQH